MRPNRKPQNLKMRHTLSIALGALVFAASLAAHAQDQENSGHHSSKKSVKPSASKHHAINVAHTAKHIVKVDLSDTPSEMDVEPLSIGQKASEKLVLSQSTTQEKLAKKALARSNHKILLAQDLNIGSGPSLSSGSTFGTAADGRAPASIMEPGEHRQLFAQKGNTLMSVKTNSRDLKKMLDSIRKKTDQSIREEYD